MAKIPYGKLKIATSNKTNKFIFNEQEVEVLEYLPCRDKEDLISIAISESSIDGRVNATRLDALFHLYMIYSYSNISFSNKQKEEPFKTYDALESSGFITEFISAMSEVELEDISIKLREEVASYKERSNSIAGVLEQFTSKLPGIVGGINNSLNQLDQETIANLLDITKQHGAN